MQVLSCLTILLMTASCSIREDLSDCRNTLTVKVLISEDSGEPGDVSLVKDVILYVFDAHGKFLGSRNTEIGREEELNYPGGGPLTCVAWCNTASGSVDVNTTNNISDARVSLKSTGSAKASSAVIFQTPDDLLYGTKSALNNNTEEHITVYVTRMVASMKITVRNLQKWAGHDDTDYSMVVGVTKKEINFNGQCLGAGAAYIPETSFDARNDFIAPLFRMLPSKDQVLSIKIFHGETMLDEVFSGIDMETGNTIMLDAIENRTLNVLIDYGNPTNVRVTLQQAAWGVESVWKPIG
ncbi:FimB/Mfa2 family fimbrial subunit [uncultured Proteiniphilum sp.]|uniref:FimB/Mfa2 family fimbrial subunit n=1 Tax=uncultured Proteiniphilum sp. TaxID=497637 RepID=UPI00260D05EA|nr:FimB/Mfa2 family fimbrial subunit [uncultured Proteiniphilum sp.]